MAKGRTVVEFIHPEDDITLPSGTSRGRILAALINKITAYVGGLFRSTSSVQVGQGGAKATGTLTLASSTGTVGGSINGVAITVTWATSDTATAAALATAINASANALVAGVVTATSALGVVTLTAANFGKVGNSITLAATGTNVTASGARLTGGTSATLVTLTR